MDYRDPLGQAHERIVRLEEELAQERAKNAPAPPPPPSPPAPPPPIVAKAAPGAKVPLFRFWALPLAVACAIPLAVHRLPFESSIEPSDVGGFRLMLGAFGAAFLLSLLEAVVRARAGHPTTVSRLLLVGAAALGLPGGLIALTAGVTIVSIGFAAGAAILGLVMLVRWVAKG